MKRMLVRLSALTAVMSLGAFAVVQAQRSNQLAEAKAAAVAAANDEPAELTVDDRTAKPIPPPTELETAPDRYAQRSVPQEVPAAAVDPFNANRGAQVADETMLADNGGPLDPVAEDAQSIPPAADALRRHNAAGARQAARGADIQPLGYEDGGSADDAPPSLPTDETSFPPIPDRNEPTLAPPRATTNRYRPTETTAQPEEDPSVPADAGDVPNGFAQESSRDTAAPADRFGRGAAQTSRGREPALLPADSLDDKQQLMPSNTDNFAPPQRSREATATATAEGAGRPGGKHLEGPQQPTLTLEKIAPQDMQVGKPAVVVLKIRNTGPVPAAHVEIHDQIPKGTQLLSTTPRATEAAPGELVWTLGALKPGEETSVELELMPVAEGEVGSVATVHFAAESSMRTTVTKPVLTLDVRTAREVMLGEDLSIVIKVSNTGTGAATGVVLREAVPEQLQHAAGPEVEYEIGLLKPGETRELDLTMRAVKAGRVVNTLAALGEGSLRVDQQTDLEVVAPALAVKMEGPARRYLDRQATYTVTVTNPGTASAKEISLVTHLPAGLKFVEANNAGQYDPRTRAVSWLLDELPAKETGSVTMVTLPVEVGEQLIRIESMADRGLSAQDEKSIMVEGVAAIFFEVVDVADPVEVGGETAYEVRVVNQGTKAATNVQVVALFPEELKPTGAEGPNGLRFTIDGQRVLFEGLAQLVPKADTTYKVKAQGRSPGDVRVRVQLLNDEIRTPITKEESTRVYADE